MQQRSLLPSPLKGFTNLATPCADNQLEVTRVKKSTLSAEAQTSDDQPEQKRRKAVHTRKRPAAHAGVDDNQQDFPGKAVHTRKRPAANAGVDDNRR